MHRAEVAIGLLVGALTTFATTPRPCSTCFAVNHCRCEAGRSMECCNLQPPFRPYPHSSPLALFRLSSTHGACCGPRSRLRSPAWLVLGMQLARWIWLEVSDGRKSLGIVLQNTCYIQ